MEARYILLDRVCRDMSIALHGNAFDDCRFCGLLAQLKWALDKAMATLTPVQTVGKRSNYEATLRTHLNLIGTMHKEMHGMLTKDPMHPLPMKMPHSIIESTLKEVLWMLTDEVMIGSIES